MSPTCDIIAWEGVVAFGKEEEDGLGVLQQCLHIGLRTSGRRGTEPEGLNSKIGFLINNINITVLAGDGKWSPGGPSPAQWILGSLL
jgi:hypothetical protein